MEFLALTWPSAVQTSFLKFQKLFDWPLLCDVTCNSDPLKCLYIGVGGVWEGFERAMVSLVCGLVAKVPVSHVGPMPSSILTLAFC